MHLTRVFVFFTTFCVIQGRYTGNTIRDLLEDLLDDELNDIDTRDFFHHKRIIHGEAAKSSSPWLVSLKKFDETTGKISFHFCGSSLLNSRWLLTAGHCLGGDTEEEANGKIDIYQARLGDKEVQASAEEILKNDIAQFLSGIGDLDLKKEEMNELLNWMDWQVDLEKIIIHPDYAFSSELGHPNDIALIKLAQDVPATPDVVSRISAVTLPEQTDDLSWPPEGTNCSFKGWGCTEIGGRTTDLLRKTNLTIQSGEKCNEIALSSYQQASFDTRICAGNMPSENDIKIYVLQNDPAKMKYITDQMGEEAMEEFLKWESTGSGGCPGDSGGPLMCEKDGEWVQAGIASWINSASTGAARRFPTVFTRVSRYVDWIRKTIAEN